jgi:hypothetical protein
MDKLKEIVLIICIAGFATTGCATSSFVLGGATAIAAMKYLG